ncbi:putative oxidoreductase YdgJ [Novipirellula artificiosorum]|uniref:Putative oxidoreductase YdgJ n=2 Tax=Novipirellula artificiosorum TaxID=2528016 RepID=A0A5C6D638_9BACT|nr:putative oxidoreductase YdgJ [Novipirellula artificiosorum]
MTPPNGLMIGTGEYTTGFVGGAASRSDKSAGVVALSLFDLRRRGRVGDLAMVGTNGTKFPGLRQHLHDAIETTYRDMNVDVLTFPADHVECDPAAYLAAMDTLSPGDFVTLFTPDDLHFPIAIEAVNRGLHVLIAKPLVKLLSEHLQLIVAAEANNVVVALEVHKRWDPIYRDARDRIRSLGEFSHFMSYMSQPKTQLGTFRSWAGKSSDISYYLNAHHIDYHAWCIVPDALPRSVYATAATGIAKGLQMDTEDTIALNVVWENVATGNLGTAHYVASWVAPPSDVHSQQRFFYMGHQGEVTIDQAHRGYTLSTDKRGYASSNPLFMKYTPNAAGEFAGQSGYGYLSIEAFVDAVCNMRKAGAVPSDFSQCLALAQDTVWVTAILEGGRRSLDSGTVQNIRYEGKRPIGFDQAGP